MNGTPCKRAQLHFSPSRLMTSNFSPRCTAHSTTLQSLPDRKMSRVSTGSAASSFALVTLGQGPIRRSTAVFNFLSWCSNEFGPEIYEVKIYEVKTGN